MNKGLIQILIYGVPVIIILLLSNSVLKKFGLSSNPAERKKDRQIIEDIQKGEKMLIESQYFNPLYHLNAGSFRRLSDELASKYARDIKKAVKWFGTDEGLIYSTFNKLNNKINISQIADKYYQIYKDDLKADLLDDLGIGEQYKLFEVIKTLPDRN